MRELNQQEVDESHCTEQQALDENWQPGTDGENSDSSLLVGTYKLCGFTYTSTFLWDWCPVLKAFLWKKYESS